MTDEDQQFIEQHINEILSAHPEWFEPPGYSDLQGQLEFLERHVEEAAKQYEQIAREIVELRGDVTKAVRRLNSIRPDRLNCKHCGREIKSSTRVCTVCGRPAQ